MRPDQVLSQLSPSNLWNYHGWICPNCGQGCSPSTPYCCRIEAKSATTKSPNSDQPLERYRKFEKILNDFKNKKVGFTKSIDQLEEIAICEQLDSKII